MQQRDTDSPILCRALHGGNCAELLQGHFQFCPVCGRRAGRLSFPTAPGTSSTIHLVLQPGQTAQRVRLNNDGPSSLSVEVSVNGPGLTTGVKKLAVPGRVSGEPGQKILDLRLEPLAGPDGQAQLTFSSATAPPGEDPWGERPAEMRHVRVEWHERRPAQLTVLTPTLQFHSRAGRQRALRICNTGDLPLPLLLPPLPSDFAFGEMQVLPAELAPGQELALPLCFRGGTMPAARHTLFFDAQSARVPFYLVTEQEQAGAARPDWIIAIDFGTSNTSVVGRSIPGNGLRPDEGQCIPLHGNDGKDRFSSAMLYNARERRWTFGDEAERQAQFSNPDVMLIDDRNSLKMSLGQDREPYLEGAPWSSREWMEAHPSARSTLTVASLLQTYFRHLKSDVIDPHLSEQADAHVQYVLSLPVLDGLSGERYQRQRDRMLQGFSHVFDVPEEQIITELEPNCAANHLLLGKGYPLLRALVKKSDTIFSPGDRFVVVDSGGGTTDIAYGEFEEIRGTGGQLQFRILRNLGLGTDQKSFGGRTVSDFLHRSLNTATTPDYHHSPCLVPNEHGTDMGDTVADFGPSCNVVSSTIEKSLKPAYAHGHIPEGMPKSLTGDLGRFSDDAMAKLLRALRDADPEGYRRKPPRWVFLVGGNTLVQPVQAFCSKYLAGDNEGVMPKLPEDERFLAVAMGAAFAEGLFAPEFAKETVTLTVTDEGGREYSETLQAKLRPLTDHEITQAFTGPISLALRSDADELVRQLLGAAGLTTRLRATVRSGRLTIVFRAYLEADTEAANDWAVLYDGTL